MTPEPQVDVRLHPDDLRAALRHDAAVGLTSSPKSLPPKWFYDDRGCELFDQITRLEEYYPTETERSILAAAAPSIVQASRADTVVELGSGTSDKTRTLLDAFAEAGRLARFVPFEVNEATTRSSAATIGAEYPNTAIHAVVGDFEHHLDAIPANGRRLFAFLGSTIGNFVPDERKQFLGDLTSTMQPGDSLLLGTDLVKDARRIATAYNDSAGLTAAFNLNVLAVLNRELSADFDLDHFSHRACWDPDAEWIEMRLVSDRHQHVHVGTLDLDVDFTAGEEMRTEISAKFRRDGITTELASAGLRLEGWYTDADEDFALSLAMLD